MGIISGNRARRIIASFMAVTVLMPSVLLTGCNKGSGLPDKVTEDMPWFDAISFDVKDDFDPDSSFYAEYQLLGVKDGKIFVKAYGERKHDDHMLLEDREEFWLLTYDFQGNLLDKSLMLDLLADQFPLASDMKRYVRVMDYDGQYICVAFDDDDEDYNAVSHQIKYDPIDGTIIETESDGEEFLSVSNSKYSIIDGYSVKTSQILGAMGSAIAITITDPDGQVTKIDMSKEFPSMNLVNCEFIFKRNEGEAFLGMGNGGLKHKYFSIDLSSKKITEIREPQEFIEAYFFFDGRYIEGIGNIVPNSKGIDVIDLKNETVENFFDINNCNMNRYSSSFIEVNDVSEDCIIFSSRTSFDIRTMLDGHLNVYILKKCETNPHVGKDIIRIASYGDLSFAMCEGICKYNNTSGTHLIMIDERYDKRRQNVENIGTPESSTDMFYDQLIADIQNGTGPDMIFNLSNVEQLYNSNYLVDISDVTGPDLIEGVIEAVKTPDGKLYHMPLSFTPAGIITLKDKVPDGTVGLTFEEYKNFVADVCNGEDPLAATNIVFLTRCIEFYGRDLDLDSEDFASLAGFARDDFTTTVQLDPELEIYLVGSPDEEYADAFYMENMSFDFLLNQSNGNLENKTLIGFPSAERMGPRFAIDESIAITAGSNNIDACKDVVRLLLGEDIQSLYSSLDGNPVSRKGLENNIADAVWFYNDQTDRYLTYFTPEEVENNGRTIEHIDADEITKAYLEMIDRCSGLYSIDLVAERIICEEMEAYFAGQKELDEVVVIIKDRINTYRNEHK